MAVSEKTKNLAELKELGIDASNDEADGLMELLEEDHDSDDDDDEGEEGDDEGEEGEEGEEKESFLPPALPPPSLAPHSRGMELDRPQRDPLAPRGHLPRAVVALARGLVWMLRRLAPSEPEARTQAEPLQSWSTVLSR